MGAVGQDTRGQPVAGGVRALHRTVGIVDRRVQAGDRFDRDAAFVGPPGSDRLWHSARDDHGGVLAGQGVEAGERRAEAGEGDPQGRSRFLGGRARPATSALTEHDCSIVLSTNYAHTQRQENPSARQLRDTELKDLIKEIFDADYRVHGARKI